MPRFVCVLALPLTLAALVTPSVQANDEIVAIELPTAALSPMMAEPAAPVSPSPVAATDATSGVKGPPSPSSGVQAIGPRQFNQDAAPIISLGSHANRYPDITDTPAGGPDHGAPEVRWSTGRSATKPRPSR